MDRYLNSYLNEQDAAAADYETDAAFRQRCKRYAELHTQGVDLPEALRTLAQRGIESEVY